MQRLLLPLCVIGVLIGAGTASGLSGTWTQMKDQLEQISSFATASEPDAVAEARAEEDTQVGPLFLDVDPTAWYKPYVSAAVSLKIASGYANADGTSMGYFGPADKVSVAQAMKMAVRAAGVDENTCIEPSEHPHPSTQDDAYAAYERHWSNAFIGCALMRDARILKLRPDVDRPAKRGEFIGIIHDVFGIDAPQLTAIFADTKGHAYEADVAYATIKKIVSGDFSADSTPSFRPDEALNRAEAAKMVIQAMDVYGRSKAAASVTGR